MEKLAERFLTCVKVNTRSDASSQTTPTTIGQVVLVGTAKTELHELGSVGMHYNEQNDFLTARLPGSQLAAKSVGLIAHLDTADLSVENIRLRAITNYDDQDVLLSQEQGIVSSVAEFPSLKEYQGETLITTDETALLGADDEAEAIEILTAVEYLSTYPKVTRGDIWLVFGPGEEIGRGTDQFDAPSFPAAFVYTIDSGRVGHFEYEAFNAAQAAITIKGTGVYPGTAHGSLVNVIKLDEQFDRSLPQKEVPGRTRGNEEFYLLSKFTGSIGKAELVYITRDHDRENLQARR